MAEQRTVCFVTPFFYPVIGGVETHILEVSRELQKKGWKVYVVTSDSDRFGSVKTKEETYQGIKIVRCPTVVKLTFGEVIFPGAVKAIREINPDVIHFHGYRHWYNLLPFVLRQPTFLTPHWPDYRGQRHKAVQLLADVIDFTIGRGLLRRADKICVVTDAEKPWLREFGISDSKIVLTPNALPIEYSKKVLAGNFRKKYKLGDRKVILSVARIHRSKGLDHLIKAARAFPECRFVIIGKDGGAQEELEALIKHLELKNVIFTGAISEKEKRQAYAGSDIYCQPSHFEAFGIAILEAMSHSLPCIVCKKGGMPWVVQDTGLLFDENDQEGLEKQIQKLISNESLRKRLGKKAQQRAKQFTWKKTAEILDKEYRKSITKSNE